MKRIALCIAILIVVSACTQNGTAPEGSTTTINSWTASYNAEEVSVQWEQSLIAKSEIPIVKIPVADDLPGISLILMREYPENTVLRLRTYAEDAVRQLPKELLQRITPLRIYVSDDDSACLSKVATGGCVRGGNVIWMYAHESAWASLGFFADSLTHEIGHLIDWHEQLRLEYAPIREATGVCAAPGAHAQTALHEDIAESFMLYARYPEVLQRFAPERYAFFEGRFKDLQWVGSDQIQEQIDAMVHRLEIIAWNCRYVHLSKTPDLSGRGF